MLTFPLFFTAAVGSPRLTDTVRVLGPPVPCRNDVRCYSRLPPRHTEKPESCWLRETRRVRGLLACVCASLDPSPRAVVESGSGSGFCVWVFPRNDSSLPPSLADDDNVIRPPGDQTTFISSAVALSRLAVPTPPPPHPSSELFAALLRRATWDPRMMRVSGISVRPLERSGKAAGRMKGTWDAARMDAVQTSKARLLEAYHSHLPDCTALWFL